MMQRRVCLTVHDDAGRTTRVDARTLAAIQLAWDPAVYLNEAAAEVELDGIEGVGWLEFCWNRDDLDSARQHVEQYGGEGS